MSKQRSSVEDLLLDASEHLVPAETEDKPWVYGWSLDDYRRSPRAALPGTDEPITFDADGLAAYEDAMASLLREPAIQRRWDPPWFWGKIAMLLVRAAASEDRRRYLTAELSRLRECGPSLVVVPLANVSWAGEPLVLSDTVVGVLNDDFASAIKQVGVNRPTLDGASAQHWIESQLRALPAEHELVVFATWTAAQERWAEEVARSLAEDLCGVALLLEPEPGRFDMWSLRGDANRPGIRGLTRDHRTLHELLNHDEIGKFELASHPLVLDDGGRQQPAGSWYYPSPMPLDLLLADKDQTAFARTVSSPEAIPRRLRVAARWHSEAHWALDVHDAALALGVALDAMVGARHGLPGQVLATRFAYLEPDAELRRERVARWNDIYAVRSRVAHGGVSASLTGDYVRDVARDVVWAATRLLAIDKRFSPRTENDFEEVMNRFRLGELTW
jgi:hypothetical protein